VLRLLPNTANEANYAEPNWQFPTFLLPILLCKDHILSPAADALSHHQPFCYRRNFAKKRISNFKIRKSSAFGVFQSPEVSKKIVKISGFLYLVFNV
jgi:hypothetical protein